MEKEHIRLTEAEWAVMECLWEKEPRTGREVVQLLGKRMGWTRSTSLTLLRRLEAKGAVAGLGQFFRHHKRGLRDNVGGK